jgi:hypothetical protein
MTNHTPYLSTREGGRRCADRVTELTEQLAWSIKAGNGLLATIRRLEQELAKAKGELK